MRADLVVGADGRHSIVRERAGLPVEDLGAPIDVLWMRLSRSAERPDRARSGAFDAGTIFVMIDRGDYWQCAFVIPKGGIEEVQRAGLAAFRDRDRRASRRSLRDRVDELRRAGTTSSC